MSIAVLPVILSLLALAVLEGVQRLPPFPVAEVRYHVDANAGPHYDWKKRFTLRRGDQVRVLERTQMYEEDDVRQVDTWVRILKQSNSAWIPAHATDLDGHELRALRQASFPPFTVTSKSSQPARAAPDDASRTLFSVSRGQKMHVIGRSDDSEWIAVTNPNFEFERDGSHKRLGWLRSDVLTPARGRLNELPAYLPAGLAASSVIGVNGSLRLAEVAQWGSWAWSTTGPTLWYHRLTEEDSDELWNAPRHLSSVQLWNQHEIYAHITDYGLHGLVLAAPLGDSLLVRGHGSPDEPTQQVIILEPDGRTYSLGDQHAWIATDAPYPLSNDAQWSPDGRYVLLMHPQSSERAFVLHDRNGELKHLGIGSQAMFHPDSGSVFYLHDDQIQRVDLQGRAYTDFRPIPHSSRFRFELSGDGRHIIALNETHDLIAILTSSDGSYVRAWRVDALPRFSTDGTRVLYSLDGQLWIQDIDDSDLRKVGQMQEERGYYAWSPDGSRVAYRSPEGLRIAPATGPSTITTLIVPGFQFGDVQWSPDGRFLAVETHNVRWPPDLPSPDVQLTVDGLAWTWVSAQIRVYATDGRLHKIWRVSPGCRFLQWSPDSKWLAYGGPSGCA